MTRSEIERHALDLSEDERVALARSLLDSVGEAQRKEVRAPTDGNALGERLRAEMEAWFDSDLERVELTPERWQEILRQSREDESLDEPFGDGVPPEWRGRTPRELRAANKRE